MSVGEGDCPAGQKLSVGEIGMFQQFVGRTIGLQHKEKSASLVKMR